MSPAPRNFADAAWQASVTDAQLAKAIVGGGSAVGKASNMPPQPDLGQHPEALARLLAHLRGMVPAPR